MRLYNHFHEVTLYNHSVWHRQLLNCKKHSFENLNSLMHSKVDHLICLRTVCA